MSKVEEKSRQYFLDKYYRKSGGTQMVFDVPDVMTAYEEGYRQAEKDLELTVDDIKSIDRLLNQCVDCSNPHQEVLKRFKERE